MALIAGQPFQAETLRRQNGHVSDELMGSSGSRQRAGNQQLSYKTLAIICAAGGNSRRRGQRH